jgi:hypothetical protein
MRKKCGEKLSFHVEIAAAQQPENRGRRLIMQRPPENQRFALRCEN